MQKKGQDRMTATIYANVPPLEERALSNRGRELIEYIAARERKNLPTGNVLVNRFMAKNPRDRSSATHGLLNAGLLQAEHVLSTTNVAKPGNLTLYRLTDKAWRIVGNRPIWHEDATP